MEFLKPHLMFPVSYWISNGDASKVSIHDVEVYIVQRAATFFQYVMNPDFPTLKHTKFVSCLNSRYGCNSDSATSCNSTRCVSSATANSISKSEINDATFKLHPNPAINVLHIQTNGTASFSLLNQSGKILLISRARVALMFRV